jgi:hypothetical protein
MFEVFGHETWLQGLIQRYVDVSSQLVHFIGVCRGKIDGMNGRVTCDDWFKLSFSINLHHFNWTRKQIFNKHFELAENASNIKFMRAKINPSISWKNDMWITHSIYIHW